MSFDQSSVESSPFLHGECHLFAIVASQMLKLPIVAAIAFDDDIEEEALVHCWVRFADGVLFDTSGFTTLRDSLPFYPGGDIAQITSISSRELLQLGEGVDSLQAVSAETKSRMDVAIEHVKLILESEDIGFDLTDTHRILEDIYGNARHRSPSAR